MSRERELVEAFFFRTEPLAVALLAWDSSPRISFGFSLDRYIHRGDPPNGMGQSHFENLGVTIYSARVAKAEVLVALHQFVEDPTYQPKWPPFVRLATALTTFWAGPPPELPTAGVAVNRPNPSGSPAWLRQSHAHPESEDQNGPA
jgi:hypothetical protein